MFTVLSLKDSHDPRSSDYNVDTLLHHESIGHLLDNTCEITARNSNELQDKVILNLSRTATYTDEFPAS